MTSTIPAIDDPRDIADVVADFMVRHDYSRPQAAVVLGVGHHSHVGKWLTRKTRPANERGIRAIMTLHDEGRM